MTETTVSADGATALGAAGPEAAEASRLPFSVIFAFSAPRIAFGLMMTLFMTYLMKFCTDVLLIAPAAMGILFLIARIWDGISDPLAGFLSDRTRSRYGRRRSWMFAASVPMGVTMFMLWSPPAAITGTLLIVWVGLCYLAYETAQTAYLIPHGGLGAELTQDYDDRTRLFGLSHIIGYVGMAIGLVSLYLMTIAEDKRSFASGLSLAGGISVAVVVFWATLKLPERKDYQGRGSDNIFRAGGDVFRNPHSRLLLTIFAIESFGSASLAILGPYVSDYVAHEPSAIAWMYGAYLAPQVIFAPIFMQLARRFGKKQLWLVAMVLTAFGYLGLFMITEETKFMLIVGPALVGIGASCGAIVAPSIMADIIDYDEYLTGERKEGTYLAVWNLVRKFSSALPAMMTGFALTWLGFEPNVEQSEVVKFTMRALFGLMPAACYGIGTLLFLRFRLNKEEHAAVIRELEARKAARGQTT